MSDPHADPAQQHDPHGDVAGADGHGGHDAHDPGHGEHGHEQAALGPIDVVAWGAGLLGVLAGLGMALALAIATNRIPV